MTAPGEPAPPAPDPLEGLVRLADGEHLAYARLVARRADGRVVVGHLGASTELVFDGPSQRLISPRGFRPRYQLAAPMPAFRVAAAAAPGGEG